MGLLENDVQKVESWVKVLLTVYFGWVARFLVHKKGVIYYICEPLVHQQGFLNNFLLLLVKKVEEVVVDNEIIRKDEQRLLLLERLPILIDHRKDHIHPQLLAAEIELRILW